MSTILNGRFRLVKAAASGGTANVYLAEEVATGKKVAVKVLKKTLPDLDEMIARFEREAQVMENVRHPNIVRLVHYEQAPEGFVLLTEWVEGKRLDVLLAEGPMKIATSIVLLKQLASALAAIHGLGIMHRDLKPENLAVTAQGVLKLFDFGIARFTSPQVDQFLTSAGKIAGTPSYLSPEQALQKPSDARTDVYTFGVLAFRLLTGRVPFEGKNDFEVLSAHVKKAPPPLKVPGVPPKLAALVMQCLEKSPDDRPADGAALMAALR